jgi:thiol:disulfide interchange protein DsbA
VDYERVEQPGTYLPTKQGEVEIVEIFAYTCPHCAHLAPELEAWKAKLPKNVRVRYTPAGYDPTDTLSRGFFASEALGTLGLTHANTFRAIHEAFELPRNPTDAELAAYYKTLGVDAAKFQAEMDGAKVMQRMQAAKAFSLRVGLQGTPSLIVAGRWRVLGHSLEDMLRIAGELAVHPPQGS